MIPRRLTAALLLCLVLPVAAAAQRPAASPDEDLLVNKCSLCHTMNRMYALDPARAKEMVDRMTAKNPDWFQDVDKAHVVEALAKLLNDPGIVARRKAWEETVAKGKALFADPGLGTVGKACAGCHAPEALRRVAEEYPSYDLKLNRYISMTERINLMIADKMAEPALPPGDARLVELEAYLKTLR